MPGVSTIEDKTLVIRGMPERYTLFTLNGIPLPITNIERKSFDYNAFPTNSLLSLDMQKSTHASDLTGGVAAKIDLETVGIPDKNQISAGVQLFYNSYSSFKKLNRYATDKNGIGNYLSQPSGFFDHMKPGELSNQPFGNQRSLDITQNFNNPTSPETYNGLLGRRWNLGIQRRFDKKSLVWGFSLMVDGMNNSETEDKSIIITGFYDPTIGKTIGIDEGTYDVNTQSQFINAIASLGAKMKLLQGNISKTIPIIPMQSIMVTKY